MLTLLGILLGWEGLNIIHEVLLGKLYTVCETTKEDFPTKAKAQDLNIFFFLFVICYLSGINACMEIIKQQTTAAVVIGVILLIFYVLVPLFYIGWYSFRTKDALMNEVNEITNYQQVVTKYPKKLQTELERIFAEREATQEEAKEKEAGTTGVEIFAPVVQILIGSFEERFYWWKLALMLERALLAIVVLSGVSPLFAVIVVGFGWAANCFAQPYWSDAEDRVDMLARTTSLVTVVLAYLVEIGTVEEDEFWLAVVLNSFSLITLIVIIMSIGPVRVVRSIISWIKEKRRAGKFAGGQRTIDKMTEADLSGMSEEEFESQTLEIKNMLAVKFASTIPMIAKWQRVNSEMSEIEFKVLVRAANVFGRDEAWVIEMLNKKFIVTEDRNVVEINWNEQGLQGVVPYQLAALKSLRKIDLSGNEISLSSAQEVTDLQARLGGNFIVDSQDKVTVMSAWEKFGGERSILEDGAGSTEYSKWLGLTVSGGNVVEIDWKNAGFEGEVPDEIVNLPKLSKIDLRGNSLMTGRMSSLVEGLRTKLGSKFLCDPPSIEQDKNVVEVCFLSLGGSIDVLTKGSPDLKTWLGIKLNSENRVTPIHWPSLKLKGTIPCHLEQLDSLTYLNLQHNSIVFNIPKEIGGLKKLKEIYLANNRLTGNLPKELGGLQNLEVLDVSNNSLDGEVPEELGKCGALKRVSLIGYRLKVRGGGEFDEIVKKKLGEERFWI
ncbi:hypothetical protein TrST_g6941 [Triparma strigata]|uniref:Uncharacterized protein n=1 Tax=Triparma strigata TaxID=1606541 RepID=A0A9W7F061_9STRA|nr:hypothetical protein TrST_g6941 [Triparma strigata]